MDIRELRLGNMVHTPDTNQDIPVSALNSFTNQVYVNNNILTPVFADKVEPIALTEDLIFKCGFGKNNNVFELDNEFHVNVEFELSNSIGRDWGVHIDNSDFQTICVGDVQFLHQLQNLYFFATGKELEVNL